MQVTFLGHSGFLLEWDTCYWLFDYFTGQIPTLDAKKKIFVFSSHGHMDHYNPKILDLLTMYPSVQYILSSDIKRSPGGQFADQVLWVEPDSEYDLTDGSSQDIAIRTLESTDLGVAFLLRYRGRTIYHAGDLNLWVWEGEPEEDNLAMTAAFSKQMEHLRGVRLDIAFAPLDPRQEELYHVGLDGLLSTAEVKYLFPMHFVGDFAIISRYRKERQANLGNTWLADMREAGQTWDLDV